MNGTPLSRRTFFASRSPESGADPSPEPAESTKPLVLRQKMLGPSADAARRNRDGVTISFSKRGSRSSDHLVLSVLRLVRLIGSEKIWERERRWLLGCNHSRPIYLPNLWRGLVLAEANRELVVDEFAATASEDRRAAGKTCARLLACAGTEPFDAVALRKHRGEHCSATRTGGIGELQGGADFSDAGCNERGSLRGIHRNRPSWEFGLFHGRQTLLHAKRAGALVCRVR